MKESWKNNNNLLSLKESWSDNHDMYKDMAYDAVAELIMNSSHMDSILDIIAETASTASDMWNPDIIDKELYDLVNEDFSTPIYQALNIMADTVERKAQKLGYKNPNVQGPLK